MKLWAVWKR